MDVSGPDSSEAVLEDLIMDSRYSISLVAISQHLPSETLTLSIQLLGNRLGYMHSGTPSNLDAHGPAQ